MTRAEFLRGMVGVVGVSALSLSDLPSKERTELLECYVRGFQYYQGPSHKDLLNREHLALRLVREANNRHDKHAIAVFLGDNQLGYIPREKNQILSKLLDANVIQLGAKITAFHEKAPAWESLKISVFLA